jgi:DNA-binding PadR family transcriptional regulator
MTIAKLPMREPTYFTLAALLDGPLHGYAIIKHVGELSEGRVRLAAGTLYAVLDRLATQSLIQVVNEEIVSGRARRYYDLTDQGRAAVRAEAVRMATAARLVTRRPARGHTSSVARPA